MDDRDKEAAPEELCRVDSKMAGIALKVVGLSLKFGDMLPSDGFLLPHSV